MQRLVFLLAFVFAASSCSKQADTANTPPSQSASTVTDSNSSAKPTESAVAPEVNPPGDIPDTQQFVKYTNASGHYELEVPEGWARTENGSDVSFVNKIDGVSVTIRPAAAAPTAVSARNTEAKQIEANGHAVSITNVSEITVPAGKAVRLKYSSNSDPNAVTNKQIRLENEAYLFFRDGKVASLTVWAPKGADNVDQWNRMSKSFRWK